MMRSRSTAFVLAAMIVALSAGQARAGDDTRSRFAGIEGSEKISTTLLEAADAVISGKATRLGAFAPKKNVVLSSAGDVWVEVIADRITPDLRNKIKGLGGQIVYVSENHNRVTMTIGSTDTLFEIAKLPTVRMIFPSSQASTNSKAATPSRNRGTGSVDGFADQAINSDLVRARYGVSGAGVRVGILSDSFAPSDSVLRGQDGFGSAQTSIISELTLEPNTEYTVVVQTASASSVDFAWEATAELLSSNIVVDPQDPSGICRNRAPMRGSVGKLSRTTAPEEQFFGGSCIQNANNFSLYAFRTPDGANIRLTITGTAAQITPTFLSVRTRCSDVASEVACSSTASVNGDYAGLLNQLSGDLPAAINVLQEGPLAQGNEGAAMGELIYDIAPGVDMSFHTAFLGEASFADGILKLAAISPFNVSTFSKRRSTVIVDDVIYFAEPMYQEGIIARAARQAVEAGYPVFSAAGNGKNHGFRVVYRDVNPGTSDGPGAIPRGNDLARLPTGNGYMPIVVPPGESFLAIIQWNQPFESVSRSTTGSSYFASQIDLNAYLALSPNAAGLREVYSNNAIIEGRLSADVQGDTNIPIGDPIESVSYFNASGEPKTVYLAIDHARGSKGNIPQSPVPLEFRVVFFRVGPGVTFGSISNNTTTGGPTIYGHSVAEGVVSVGAVNYLELKDPTGGPSDLIDPEEFTAKGGVVRSIFNQFGSVDRRFSFEPDIASVDGNNTTFFPITEAPDGAANDQEDDGNPNFFGTSAAAPNTAAIAALLREINDSLTPGQIERSLIATARDVTGERAAVGIDDTTGAGVTDALAAADFAVANYGNTKCPPGQICVTPARKLDYFFNFDAEGWMALYRAGFTAPVFSADGLSLGLKVLSNIDTFGSFQSPAITLSPTSTITNVQNTLRPYPAGKTLIRYTANVSSDSTDRTRTPSVQLRTMGAAGDVSTAVRINSAAIGGMSPTVGRNARYRHYYAPANGEGRFTNFFDVLGLDNSDANNITLRAEDVELQAIDTSSFAGLQREVSFNFIDGGPQGWLSGTSRDYSSVRVAGARGTGLNLGPVKDATKASLSFWTSPRGNSGTIILRQRRLYRAIFEVSSNAQPNQITRVPNFRFRVNDASNQLNASTDVTSSGSFPNVPVAGGSKTYTLYFETPDDNAFNGLNLHSYFEYVFTPSDKNDPNVVLTLEKLTIDSFTPPL